MMAGRSLKQHLLAKATGSGTPVNGTFELTARCNLSCRMCYIHAGENDGEMLRRELSAEQWLELGRQAVDAGLVYLLLTGGEPLLRRDFARIYEGMANMGVVLSVNTNGTCLTPELLALFKRLPPEKINITLYGMSAEKYGSLCRNEAGFARVMENILLLKNAGIPLVLNTTFTAENVQELDEIVAFAKRQSIPVRTASHLFPPVRGGEGDAAVFLSPEEQGQAAARFDYLTLAPDTLDSRAAMIRRMLGGEAVRPVTRSRAAACTGGRGSFWITWDGKMTPCGMLGAPEDVTKQSFRQAWDNTRRNMGQYLLPPDCVGCNYQFICPSCVAVFAEDGQTAPTKPPQLCRRTKAYAEKLLEYAGKTPGAGF